MLDVILIVVIVAFFVGAALLVRVLDRMLAGSGLDIDPADDEPRPEVESGRAP